jgi:DNA-binding transcriptional ArsR family regulator
LDSRKNYTAADLDFPWLLTQSILHSSTLFFLYSITTPKTKKFNYIIRNFFYGSYSMKYVKRMLEWILIGSAGGQNRIRILEILIEKPCNANQLSTLLNLDYKTVRHHLDILKKNRMIISMGTGYAIVYYPSEIIKENIDLFIEIVSKFGKK